MIKFVSVPQGSPSSSELKDNSLIVQTNVNINSSECLFKIKGMGTTASEYTVHTFPPVYLRRLHGVTINV